MDDDSRYLPAERHTCAPGQDSCVALRAQRWWKLQVFGNAKPPNDELVDIHAPYPSAANCQAANRYCAECQCTHSQSAKGQGAESLRADRESTHRVRAPAAKQAQGAASH